MVIVIVGESGSGKTTMANCIVDSSNYSRIITYTTRMPRNGERDGVDYHFVPKSFFNNNANKFLEMTEYNGEFYGLLKSDIVDAVSKNENVVVIVTPSGMRRIRNIVPWSKCICVYLSVPRRDRLIKMLYRGGDIDGCYRRSLCDVGQYDGVREEADVVIENPGYKKSPDQLVQEAMTISWNMWGVSLF